MSCGPLSLLAPVSPSWLGAVDTAPVFILLGDGFMHLWLGGGDRSTETGKSIFSSKGNRTLSQKCSLFIPGLNSCCHFKQLL